MNEFLHVISDRWIPFLFSFVPAVMTITLITYVFVKRWRSRLVTHYLVFLMFLLCWQVQESLLRISPDDQSAIKVLKFLALPSNLATPAALHFILLFIDERKWKNAFLFSFLSYPVTFLFGLYQSVFCGPESVKGFAGEGWVFYPNDLINKLNVIWVASFALIIPPLLFIHYRKIPKNELTRRRQYQLMMAGSLLPAFIGVMYEMLLPVFINKPSIPITSALIATFSIASFVAITKYRMLDYSPYRALPDIMSQMNEGVLLLDADWNIKYMNPRLGELLGYHAPDLVGNPLSNFMKSGRFIISRRTEIGLSTLNQETRWFDVSFRPYREEHSEGQAILGILSDVTERKKMLEEIKSAEDKVRSLIENLSDPVFATDTSTRLLVFNKAFSDFIFKFYLVHVNEGMNIRELKRGSPVFKLWDMSISKALEGRSFSIEVERKTGAELIYYVLSLNPIRVEGKITGLAYFIRDITMLKLNEAKLKKSEVVLRGFARHLNSVLENEKTRVAREIHDELGQLLIGVKLGISSLKKFSFDLPELDARLNGMLEDVDSSIQSVRKIATELRPGILDTLGLIPSVQWLSGEFSRKTSIPCNLRIQSEYQRFPKEFSTCCFRIIQEALNNASKHGQCSRIDISITQKEEQLIIMIEDNGVGIREEELNNPFSMGLLGMRERAAEVGARLDISSRPGCGVKIQLEMRFDKKQCS